MRSNPRSTSSRPRPPAAPLDGPPSLDDTFKGAVLFGVYELDSDDDGRDVFVLTACRVEAVIFSATRRVTGC
jgi:hypothetical protein